MKFTVKKTDLIEKLKTAHEKEVAFMKTEYDRKRKEYNDDIEKCIKELNKALTIAKSGQIPAIHYYENSKPTLETESRKTKHIDAALSILSVSLEDHVVIDDKSDKWDLISILKESLA